MKARSRIIKPELYQNEDFAKLSKMARLLFPGLWMLADREGLLKDNPALIKGMLFPYESANISKLLTELDEARFIVRYAVQSIAYIWIPKFKKHQKIHPKESQSVIELNEEIVLGFTQGEPLADQFRLTSSSFSTSTSTSTLESGKPDDIVIKIIQDLNQICGTNFKPTTGKTPDWIHGRLSDGYTIKDFKAVHRVKFEEWTETDFAKNLRPKTLYTPDNFESYVNQAKTDVADGGRVQSPGELEYLRQVAKNKEKREREEAKSNT